MEAFGHPHSPCAVAIAFDMATIGVLGLLLKNDPGRVRKVALYALNPLVLLEFSVNVHTEVLMIAPCLWAIHLFRRERWNVSAIFLAIGADQVVAVAFSCLAAVPVGIETFGPVHRDRTCPLHRVVGPVLDTGLLCALRQQSEAVRELA
ncbi:MAG: hypothetical protein IPI05_16750 [Flavobacteriales bacterium]|nr:hypothetical protein [Flavobacteriales bacterium]